MVPFLRKISVIGLVALLSSSCVSIKEIIQEPEVSIIDVSISELSYFDITLEMELLVSNPNPVGIQLAGLDYDLLLDEVSFIKGDQDDEITVAAGGTSTVVIPITMNYQNLYQTVSSLADSRDADYQIVTGLSFMLPVLGKQRLELSHQGQFPLVRIPRFEFESLYVSSLGLLGADIIILLKAQNPNSFELYLNDFEGTLNINKQKWAELKIPETLAFASDEWTDMGFQIRLEFLSMGRTVRDLLSGEDALFYDYQGDILLGSSLELLKEATLPMNLSGEIGLTKPSSTTEGQHSSEKIEETIADNLLNLFGAYSR
ncbi:LEA type 2 family protein [Oceanispirochaeta crateris]|nr:LEA type 2 family protein [Oceanispirochaeta crateris]